MHRQTVQQCCDAAEAWRAGAVEAWHAGVAVCWCGSTLARQAAGTVVQGGYPGIEGLGQQRSGAPKMVSHIQNPKAIDNTSIIE